MLETPPAPLPDLRRLEEHRFDFVKSKIKKRVEEKEKKILEEINVQQSPTQKAPPSVIAGETL